ncbi:S1C family serine protease [Mesorhizobium sp. ASY16-5R]|uniref:S1C family serine protease n=1 Tax=Mesorhizobium sp. ASY16-5R TaxID=3445772 RepID=UPI003FA0D347
MLRRLVFAIIAALPAFVGTTGFAQEAPSASGTGFYINVDGWLVTNAHVVEGCARVGVAGRGDAVEWKADRQNDLAVVHSVGPSVSIVPLRRAPARLGEDIAALGFPLSTVLSSSIKITTGNINALLGIADDSRFLQVSAPVQPGNSGGPLVDRAGALVGVVSGVLNSPSGAEGSPAPQNVNFAIRSSVLELFLQSRGIAFETVDVVGQPLATADLADKVAPAVVQVLCYGAPTMPPTAAAMPDQSATPGAAQTDVTAAKNFVAAYHAAWSNPNNAALAYMAMAYGDSVNFYGKAVPVADVLAEKRKFAARWPMRYYAIQPDTLMAACQASICSVSGVVDWFAKSPSRNRSARGVATFDLTVDIGRSVILSETGRVRKGAKPAVEPLLARWWDLNTACRGGSGNEAATYYACAARGTFEAALAAADWCYGRIGEYGYQNEWHVCGPNSVKPGQ